MIKRKKKRCRECGWNTYLWSDGMCKLCASLDSGKSLSRVKRKKTGEYEMFTEIFEERPHKSQLSGKPLIGFDVSYFAHILPKGKYPEFRLKKENIFLLTRREHYLYDHGTEKQREDYCIENDCSWKELYFLKDKMKHG